jgi:hypothetical protein
MSFGLKSVRNRRDDALSRISWDRLESMLAEYYRREGYAVEHVGTGGSGRKFDGGIDLKLRKGGEYILVQSKHWNAKQVPHNAVHELLGVMVNEGATGAILVTSGEFTRAAIEAATKQGHVQLVDGDDLRAMLGPLPESEMSSESAVDRAHRLHASRSSYGYRGKQLDDRSKVMLARLALAIFALLVFFWAISRIFSTIQQIPVQQQARMQATAEAARARQQTAALPTPAVQPQTAILPTSKTAASNSYGRRDPDPCHELVDWKSGTYIDHCAQNAPQHRPTDAEIRESQRKADEAIKVIEDSTPDM